MGWTTRSSTLSSAISPPLHPLHNPRPLYLQPRSVCSLYQCYHQNDGVPCLRLVWACKCSITLHYTALRTQQSLEWKIQRDRGGGKGRDRKRTVPQREEGSSSQQQRDPPVPQRKGAPPPDPSGCRGGPCMAEKATGTMQLGLLALAMVFLSSMGHSDALKLSKARRQRRGELCLSQCVLISIFFFSIAAFHFWVTVVDVL